MPRHILCPALCLLIAMLDGCGGGGVNVLNGLIDTQVVGDVSDALDTDATKQTAQKTSAALAPGEITLSTVTRATLRVDFVDYLIAVDCDATGGAPEVLRIRGPFAVSLTDGVVTPEIPEIEAPLGDTICSASLAPAGRIPGELPPPNLAIEGFTRDGKPYAIRLPSPPVVVFDADTIAIDDEVVSVQLTIPLQAWLQQIARVANERDDRPDDFNVDGERHPELTDAIESSLPGEGRMARRPPPTDH